MSATEITTVIVAVLSAVTAFYQATRARGHAARAADSAQWAAARSQDPVKSQVQEAESPDAVS